MKVTKQETLYHKDHGATLKHKCGKRIVALSLLTFSLFFCWASLASVFMGLFCLFFPHTEQCSNNDDHHTSIYLQLKDYNLILRTRYDSICMPPAVYRDVQWIKSDMYENYEWWLCHKYDVNYMIMQGNMTMMMRVIINGTMESCMAIYLRMAMEMP